MGYRLAFRGILYPVETKMNDKVSIANSEGHCGGFIP